MAGSSRLPIKVDFKHPVEIRFGRDEQTPSCYLVRNPTRGEHESPFVIMQPEVIRQSPDRGWAKVGDGEREMLLEIGRDLSPQFDLGPDVSRRHCLISIERVEDSGLVEVETHGRNGTRVIVHPDDIGGEVESVDSDVWGEP
jgi:hypothetical protein